MQSGPNAKYKDGSSAAVALSKVYRYIFFRVSRRLRVKNPDQRGADLVALAHISIPLMGLVATAYWWLYSYIGFALQLDRQQMWMYGAAAIGSIFLFNYITFGRKQKISEIHSEFSSRDPYGKWGTWIVTAYFVIPLIIFFGALVLTAR